MDFSIICIVLTILYAVLFAIKDDNYEKLQEENKCLKLHNIEYKQENYHLKDKIKDLEKTIKSCCNVLPDEIHEKKPIKILKVTFKSLVSKEKQEEKLCEILRQINDYGIIPEDPNYTITEIEYTPVNVITCDFNIENIMNFENLSPKEE